ncbi:PREDICTED: alpha-1-acid glycoprotein-like isoform X2 [Pseudopodoces humilis]|uniref:alpha-1-acid glycoprotein-like isoform X2 n=1 Tax=Pseudopodoces humilis TaxID=181119 RepID=UPI0006B75391|nr:PREDICTED: alpha-1-acid glycoprotein-like isoform X2 [Pseudopodoces humilis]
MATAGTALLLLSLALLPADAAPCGAQRPDSSTASEFIWKYFTLSLQMPEGELAALSVLPRGGWKSQSFCCHHPVPPSPQLLGTWLYLAGAAQFPQHQVEMLLIDHAFLRLEPGASRQQLLISHYVAVGDQCFTNNLTYLEVSVGNATLVKDAKTQQTEGMLMNMSSENLLLIQYQMQKDRTYLGQYLYARNLSISTADREEFEHHVECLGLRAEQIVRCVK